MPEQGYVEGIGHILLECTGDRGQYKYDFTV
jgi:hypothetical protein